MLSNVRIAALIAALSVAWLALTPVWALATPPTAKQARKLFRLPAGSVSLGKTNHGTIHQAVEMPLKGDGYAFFRMVKGRKTHFATRELARMIQRAARIVRKRYPGSVLGIGNVAVEEGGKVGQSVSHQNGRDADLGFYALDSRRRRVNLHGFVTFRPDGWDRSRRYRFDAERTLALVEALMSDPQADVQWLFLAEWLEEPLMKLARARGYSEDRLERLETVMLQPGDSNPHSEHLHLRIYCATRDRLHGCLERGPLREWVDLGDARWEERIQALVGVLEMKQPRWRKRALSMLADIRATPAVGRIVAALEDPSASVRKAAVSALRTMRDDASLPPLADKLKETSDGDLAATIVRLMMRLEGAEADYVAQLLLERPRWLLHSALVETPSASVLRSAIRRLGRTASGHSARLVARHVADAALRKAANKALVELTGHKVKARNAATAWPRFFERHGAEGWLGWQRRGFETAGYSVPDEQPGWASLDVLIDAVGNRERLISHNASRVLTRITGYDVDPAYRTRRNNHRLWKNWRRKFRRHFGRSPETRSVRRGASP